MLSSSQRIRLAQEEMETTQLIKQFRKAVEGKLKDENTQGYINNLACLIEIQKTQIKDLEARLEDAEEERDSYKEEAFYFQDFLAAISSVVSHAYDTGEYHIIGQAAEAIKDRFDLTDKFKFK